MKNNFESLTNKIFTSYELSKVNNLDAVYGGLTIITHAGGCTLASGTGSDTYDPSNGGWKDDGSD